MLRQFYEYYRPWKRLFWLDFGCAVLSGLLELAFPLAGAAATLVGQNLGAGDVPRAWRSVRVGLAVHVPLLSSIALLTFLFRTPIMAAFSDDPAVIALGSQLLAPRALLELLDGGIAP